MIIKCELNIKPENRERIEKRLCAISEDEDVLSFATFIKKRNIIEKK